MADQELTAAFLEQLRRYLSDPEASLAECGKPLNDMAATTFRSKMKEAYKRGFLALKAPLDRESRDKLEEYWRNQDRPIKAFVASGCPDDSTFARSAAEVFLEYLASFLCDEDKAEVNIGIVSGSSTGSVVEQLVQGRLWEEMMSKREEAVAKKKINLVALNVTPVVGVELEGNANITVARLAVFLRDRLQKYGCEVKPYGLSTPLVVAAKDCSKIDESLPTKTVVEIADPDRLEAGKQSRLDFVITGVGSPAAGQSVFMTVLNDEGIVPPAGVVGDVAFAPVNAEGKELRLVRNTKNTASPKSDIPEIARSAKAANDSGECLIYSAIRLTTMNKLAKKGGTKVLLVARNQRRGAAADKTAAIIAAIRGQFVNSIVTDDQTAERLMPPDSPRASRRL